MIEDDEDYIPRNDLSKPRLGPRSNVADVGRDAARRELDRIHRNSISHIFGGSKREEHPVPTHRREGLEAWRARNKGTTNDGGEGPQQP